MFKKFLSSIMAITFIFTVTLSVPAFADENTILREENIVMVKYDTKTRETTRVEIDPNISKRNSSYNTVTEDGMESNGYHPITAEVLPTKVATESARSLAGTWTPITATTVPAYQNTVFITVRNIDGTIRKRGTGFMIGPSTVATAAHVIYNEDLGGFAYTATVHPGRTGEVFPYESADAVNFSVSNEWYNSQDKNFDWGVIELDNNVGDDVGWMGLKKLSSYNKTAIRANGYPGIIVNGETTKIMYRSNGNISDIYTYRFASTNTKAAKGMSGGPVYIKEDENDYKIIGLVRGGTDTTTNFISMTTTVYNVFISYRTIRA